MEDIKIDIGVEVDIDMNMDSRKLEYGFGVIYSILLQVFLGWGTVIFQISGFY